MLAVNLATRICANPADRARSLDIYNEVEPRRSVLRRTADDTDPVERIIVADAEYGDDVGVVKAGGGAGFLFEAQDALRIEKRGAREDFEGDVAAERFLAGFEDHAHSAATDFADDAEVAEAFDVQRFDGRVGAPRAVAGFEFLHQRDRRKNLAELIGDFWMAISVVADRWALAPAAALGELLGDEVDRMAIGIGLGDVVHGCSCESDVAFSSSSKKRVWPSFVARGALLWCRLSSLHVQPGKAAPQWPPAATKDGHTQKN